MPIYSTSELGLQFPRPDEPEEREELEERDEEEEDDLSHSDVRSESERKQCEDDVDCQGEFVEHLPQSSGVTSSTFSQLNNSTCLYDAAITYAGIGWSIVPISANKVPAVRWGEYVDRRPSPEELQKWFAFFKGINGLAVITGSASGGLICRDFDTARSYERWAKSYPRDAQDFPTVATGRGFHVYCVCEEIGRDVKLEDGELRAGGLVILPPSKHPSGKSYRWSVPPTRQTPFQILNRKQVREIDWLPKSKQITSTLDRTERTEKSEKTEETELTERTEEINYLRVLPDLNPIIKRTLPKQEGERHRQIFDLARELKTLAAYRDVDPRQLKLVVKHWHQLALPVIRTKAWEETWFSFLRGWPQIRYLKDELLVQDVADRAAEEEASEAAQFENPKLRHLVSICRELQVQQGKKPFFLSCRTAGKLIGVTHQEANRWLQGLALEGLLEVTDQGVAGGKKATRYRYLGELPPARDQHGAKDQHPTDPEG